VFSSERLVYRYPAVDEVKELAEGLASIEVQRLISPHLPLPQDPASLGKRIANSHRAPFTGAPDSFELGIFEKGKDESLVGLAGLYDLDLSHSVAEIGVSIVLGRARGKGLGTEAHLRWMEYAFTDLGLFRLTGTAKATNEPIMRVIEKTGMSVEGRLRSHRYVAGERIDILLLGILRDEWVRSRQAVEPLE